MAETTLTSYGKFNMTNKPDQDKSLLPNNFGNIESFKSKLYKGIAQPNRYMVTFFGRPKNYFQNFPENDYHILIKDVNMPGQTINLSTTEYYGSTLSVGSSMLMEKLNMTIICDSNMMIRQAFEWWMKDIFDKPSWNCHFMKDYADDISIVLYDRKFNIVKSVFINGAYPNSISDLNLAYDANDSALEFTVEFTFYNWFDTYLDAEKGVMGRPHLTNGKF